jgi:predicted AlkP superfamily phosphohydrolase/phosphomutase
LVDERQPGYSSERAAAYADFRTQAAAQLDQALSDLISVVGPDIDSGGLALFVVGTTSMAPIHTQVNINTLLEQAGLLRLGSRGFVIVEQSQAIAFTSGGAVHVYINLAGRESAGIVSTDSYGMVQDQIVQLLHDLTDPATGERVFAQVLTHDELVPMGLDPSLAGDVFAQANLGYSLSDDRGPDAIFGPVTFYGQQGYAAELDVMQGCLVAITPTIRPGSEFDSVRLVDVAPTLAELMGFQLDSTDGQVIQALMAP